MHFFRLPPDVQSPAMRILSILLLLLTAAVSLAADAPAPLPDEQRMDLFLLIGQSNMAGRGKVEAEDQVINPRIWKLDKEDHWVPSVDPLHFDKPKIAGVGLGSSFARAIAEKYPDRFVGLIPSAVGGTRIDQWKPGSDLYNEAVRRAKVAQAHGTLKGILWHQGESDSVAARVPTYLANLKEIAEHLRADLNAPDVPLIVGQIGRFHERKAPYTKQINQELLSVDKVIPNSACATSEDLTDKGDQTHFDSPSLREFGKRYAAEYFHLTATTQPAANQP